MGRRARTAFLALVAAGMFGAARVATAGNPAGSPDGGAVTDAGRPCAIDVSGYLRAQLACRPYQFLEIDGSPGFDAGFADVGASVNLFAEFPQGDVADASVLLQVDGRPRVGEQAAGAYFLGALVHDKDGYAWVAAGKPPHGTRVVIDSVRPIGNGRYEIHGWLDTRVTGGRLGSQAFLHAAF